MLNEFDIIVKSLLKDYSDFDYWNDCLKDRETIMEHFFDAYFKQTEGSVCSHDKSAFVVKKIFESIENKKNIYLKRNRKTDKEFWRPKNLKDTDLATKIFIAYINFNLEEFLKLSSPLGG